MNLSTQVYLASSPQMEGALCRAKVSVQSITPPPAGAHRQPKPSAVVGMAGDLWSWLTFAVRAQIYPLSHTPMFQGMTSSLPGLLASGCRGF